MHQHRLRPEPPARHKSLEAVKRVPLVAGVPAVVCRNASQRIVVWRSGGGGSSDGRRLGRSSSGRRSSGSRSGGGGSLCIRIRHRPSANPSPHSLGKLRPDYAALVLLSADVPVNSVDFGETRRPARVVDISAGSGHGLGKDGIVPQTAAEIRLLY